MAFTQQQLDTLDAAIAQGVRVVKYADKTVEYQSLDDMLKVRRLMAAELGLINSDFVRKFAQHSKGIEPKMRDDE